MRLATRILVMFGSDPRSLPYRELAEEAYKNMKFKTTKLTAEHTSHPAADLIQGCRWWRVKEEQVAGRRNRGPVRCLAPSRRRSCQGIIARWRSVGWRRILSCLSPERSLIALVRRSRGRLLQLSSRRNGVESEWQRDAASRSKLLQWQSIRHTQRGLQLR